MISMHGGHSLYGDGSEPLETMVRSAAGRGMRYFAITEHMPLQPDRLPGLAEEERFARYLQEAYQLQHKFRNQVDLLVGVEMEYLPQHQGWIVDFYRRFQVEMTVVSVHFVGDRCIDMRLSDYRAAVEEAGSLDGLYCRYLQLVRGAIALPVPVPRVLGHLDIIRFYGRSFVAPGEPFGLADRPAVAEALEQTLQVVRADGLLLDVNARGWIKPSKELYPSVAILRRARSLGIPATLGDDSHAPEGVGRDLERAAAVLVKGGYQEVAGWKHDGDGRVMPTTVPLASITRALK